MKNKLEVIGHSHSLRMNNVTLLEDKPRNNHKDKILIVLSLEVEKIISHKVHSALELLMVSHHLSPHHLSV